MFEFKFKKIRYFIAVSTFRRQMPPLYASDDYTKCFENPMASYCMVYAELQPDNNSVLWNQIRNHQNAYRYHYRHDQLYRGICISKLENITSISKDVGNTSAVEYQPISDNVEMAKKLHKISRNRKSVAYYERHLHDCVNTEIQQNYNLSVKTFVTYCDSPQEHIEKGKCLFVQPICREPGWCQN